jgi:hypothetical protein
MGSIQMVDGEESPSIFNNTPLSQPSYSDLVKRGTTLTAKTAYILQ